MACVLLAVEGRMPSVAGSVQERAEGR